MISLKIKIAQLCVEMSLEHEFTKNICKDYIVPDDTPADLSVSATDAQILREKAAAEALHGREFDEGYVESVCIYRNICRLLPSKNSFLLHAAVISDGKFAYAFSAPSGTGKSTHILQWRRAFGKEIFVVNGDKPIIRYDKENDCWIACGTPWCGKEGLNTNVSVPLSGICFIERGDKNEMERLDINTAAQRIMKQVIIPTSPTEAAKMLELLDAMIRSVPIWKLRCTISEEAAIVARAAMNGALDK